MLTRGAVVASAEAVAAAKDYLRIDGTGEDALVGGLVAIAVESCEGFVGRVLIARGMSETLVPMVAWQRLTAGPVLSVTSVTALALNGVESAVAGSAYELDIDANGGGRVRFVAVLATSRAVVRYQAGSGAGWADIPNGLRQGIVRLVAHWYVYRDREEAPVPPASVAALWRPERRMRLS
ncbi:MAG: Transfer Agent [Sphingomonadales bacterium]|nr:Transfer Agent [Sphingomonadales bacterium]